MLNSNELRACLQAKGITIPLQIRYREDGNRWQVTYNRRGQIETFRLWRSTERDGSRVWRSNDNGEIARQMNTLEGLLKPLNAFIP